jgi:hypothetical protein
MVSSLKIETFDGLNELISDRLSDKKSLGQIYDGENFILINKQPQSSRTPLFKNIQIPEEDYRLDTDGNPILPSKGNPYIVNGIFKFKKDGIPHLIYIIDGNVYELQSGNLVKIYLDKVDSGSLDNFCVYAKKLVIMNGIDIPLEYDGEACAQQVLNDPNDIVEDNKYFLAAEVSNNRIYYITGSKIFTPIPTSTDNFENNPDDPGNPAGTVDGLEIQSQKGASLICAKNFVGKCLLLFTDEGETFRLDGFMPWSDNAEAPHELRQVPTDLGAVSPRSAIGNNLDVYFQSDRGLSKVKAVQSYGDMSLSNIFDKIKKKLQRVLNEVTVDTSKFLNTIYLKDKIYVMYRSPDHTHLFEYDIVTEDISYSKYNIRCTYQQVVDNQIQIGDDLGRIYIIDENHYNNERSYIELNWIPTQYGVGTLKWWQEAIFVFEEEGDSDLKIEYQHIKNDIWLDDSSNIDLNMSFAVWNTAIWDKTVWDMSPISVYRLKDLGNSQAIRFRISTNTPASAFKLKSLDIYFKPQGLVKA